MDEVFPFEMIPFMPPGPAYRARAAERPSPPTGAMVEKDENIRLFGVRGGGPRIEHRPTLELMYNLAQLVY